MAISDCSSLPRMALHTVFSLIHGWHKMTRVGAMLHKPRDRLLLTIWAILPLFAHGRYYMLVCTVPEANKINEPWPGRRVLPQAYRIMGPVVARSAPLGGSLEHLRQISTTCHLAAISLSLHRILSRILDLGLSRPQTISIPWDAESLPAHAETKITARRSF